MPMTFENSPIFQILGTRLEVSTIPDVSRVVDSGPARKLSKGLECGSRLGCYIFAVVKGGRSKAWYVGKATKDFAQKVFGDVTVRSILKL
jgi:hypothetical protein